MAGLDILFFLVANNDGWGEENDPYRTCTSDSYEITERTDWLTKSVSSDYTIIAKTKGTKSDCAYPYSIDEYSSKKTWSATITEPTNGSISVSYKDESGTDQEYTSGSKSVLPTCTITVTATPSTGYKLKSLTVGGTSISSGGTYNVRSNVSIAAEFEVDCSSNHATATTGSATSISDTGASLAGTFTAGGTSVTAAGFAISKTSGSGYTNYAGKISSSNVTLTKTELDANTKYYYKTYVTDGCGTYYGTESSFTTAPGSIYVRGPIMGDNGDGGSSECWNNASYYEMQNNGSNVFTKTFNPSGNYCDYGPKEFVLTMENNDNHKLNPDWFDSKTGCQKSSRQGQGNNFESTLKYSNADELTLTVKWNRVDNCTVSLAKTETNQPNKLYIKGPFVTGNWGSYDNEATVSDNKYIFEFTADGSDDEFCLSTNTDDRGKIHYITSVGTQGGWAFADGAGSNFKASSELKGKKVKITVTWLGSSTFSMDVEANECTKPTLSISQYSGSRTDRITSVKARMNPKGDCTVTEFGVKRYTDSACTQGETTVTGNASSTAEQEIKFEGDQKGASNTQYWFKAYAITEESGTVWSDNVVTDYTRVSLPQEDAKNITSTTATLVGFITEGGNYVSNVYKAWFTYGPTTGKENTLSDIMSQAVNTEFTANISGLLPNTTYRYFVNATSKEGDINSTSNREMHSFTTNRVHSDIVLDNQSVCVGANITLEPTCATATNGFTYESKNTSVATVDANGVVHGVAAGAATITVTTKEVSGYDVKTKDITVTVNAKAFTIVVSPDSPLAYQVVTLSASNGKSTTWTKASSDAYFVGADGLVISGNEATAESIKLKAKSGATYTVYTISATQSDGTCAYNTREITVSADTENCSGN